MTETAFLTDENAARRFLDQLAKLGCRVALDDFGTGYSGLSYLKRLPVDCLKIDREFVKDVASDRASRHVVEAVVSLARGFGQLTIPGGRGRADLQAAAKAARGLRAGICGGHSRALEAAFAAA